MNRDQLKLTKTILQNELSEEFDSSETKRVTSFNEDIAISTLEEWKTLYSLSSLEDDEKSDLKTRFMIRRELLKKGCSNLQAKHETLGHGWSWQAVPRVKYDKKTKLYLMKIQNKGQYGICVIPKVGSTTWKDYAGKLVHQNIKANHTVNMIQIRHPLDRLRSAYTDKYLGGEAISAFN